ncbi:hypothetical protein [Kibdelosporangium phytohabitans]|uniref:hypothetical protein n=1 Tax=Kibdelosporangium phytohabitans TaxID=860235 RepID=UPI0012FCB586|nr:hypothetical protein [Kibdelosporangium phytohabitans]MBE1465900.1 phosphatidylglycerophosphate synthase [Kibdelosporangium phytohabitans]
MPKFSLLPAAMTMFAIGLIAIIAVFVLYASGQSNLSVWLYVAAMLLPIGLGLGIFSVVRRR